MLRDHIGNIKDTCRIYRNKEYIVLLGDKLWIFNEDDGSVICKDDFYNANKLCFLSNERILVCGGKNTMYRMISLRDGHDIWQIKAKKKVTVTKNRFTVAPDESYAFDIFLWQDSDYLVRIDLAQGIAFYHCLREGFRATVDIIYNPNGSVYLLQTQYDELGEERISRNEIRAWEGQNSFCQQCEFCLPAPSIATFFWNHEKIITNDLGIYDLKANCLVSTLNHGANHQAYGFGPNDVWFDCSGQYICIMFDNANLIVDTETNCAVGVYAGEFVRGCLIDGEYWIPSKTGIRIMPFPYIEDISAYYRSQKLI